MRPQNKILGGLGLALFFTGVLLGMAFFAVLTWASLEASFYFGYNGGAETKLRLACPYIMTPQDSGSVTATVVNKVEKTISPVFQADFSGPMLRSIRTQPSIDPAKTREIQWAISAQDVDYGSLIMVQVYQYSSYKTPTAMATCGTLFLNLPTLTGMEIYILALVLSLLGITAGILLWLINNRPVTGRKREYLGGILFLTAIVLLGILFGSLGQWMLGVFALGLSLLMFVIQLVRPYTPRSPTF